MRLENTATHIAIAAPAPFAPANWVGTSRRMIAIASLRIAFGFIWVGTTTDVGAAIIYRLVFWALLLVDAGRMSVDRLIAARTPPWERVAGVERD